MSAPVTVGDGAFEPSIVAFVCNWCTYTGADLAGTSRILMADNVRIIRLPCTGPGRILPGTELRSASRSRLRARRIWRSTT